MSFKAILCYVAAACGGLASWLFGTWNTALAVLMVCLALDYATGMIVAGVFHKSPKSENGGLESRAGWKGLARKVGTLCLVALANLVDKLTGTAFIRGAVVIGYCTNEILSILENLGLMGLPIDKLLKNAVDLLRKKEETK